MPSMIDDEFFDSQVEPSAIRPDGQPAIVAFFIKTIELYDIVNDILLDLYQGSTDAASREMHYLTAALQFDDRLLRWAASLPEHLQYPPPKQDKSLVYERQRIVLHAR